MRRIGLAWWAIIWLLALGWIPVIAEASLNHFFHIEQRFPSTILIIPYIEFVTLPLTCLAILTGIFKAVQAVLEFLQYHRHDKRPS